MDGDTIFPALPDGERIIDKYEYSDCCSCLRVITILTNLRLLICRRYTTCVCCTRSSYTSIGLDSIERVDEEPANARYRYVFGLIFLLLSGITLLANGALLIYYPLIIAGVIPIVLFVIIVILLFIFEKNVLITLTGTFGRDSLKLSKSRARQLEGQLIEMCFKTQLLYMSQLTMQYEQQIRQSLPPQHPVFAVKIEQPVSESDEPRKINNVKRKQVKEDRAKIMDDKF
jgi:hypothetical protein